MPIATVIRKSSDNNIVRPVSVEVLKMKPLYPRLGKKNAEVVKNYEQQKKQPSEKKDEKKKISGEYDFSTDLPQKYRDQLLHCIVNEVEFLVCKNTSITHFLLSKMLLENVLLSSILPDTITKMMIIKSVNVITFNFCNIIANGKNSFLQNPNNFLIEKKKKLEAEKAEKIKQEEEKKNEKQENEGNKVENVVENPDNKVQNEDNEVKNDENKTSEPEEKIISEASNEEIIDVDAVPNDTELVNEMTSNLLDMFEYVDKKFYYDPHDLHNFPQETKTAIIDSFMKMFEKDIGINIPKKTKWFEDVRRIFSDQMTAISNKVRSPDKINENNSDNLEDKNNSNNNNNNNNVNSNKNNSKSYASNNNKNNNNKNSNNNNAGNNNKNKNNNNANDDDNNDYFAAPKSCKKKKKK